MFLRSYFTFTIRLLSNTDTATIAIKNKLFNALVKPVLLYACEIWGPELLSYKTPFDKSTIKQVHIKFCKHSLNVPWYIENIACRAELGRYPLNIDIKASIFSYWQRLKHSANNVLLREAFQYITKIHLSSTFNSENEEINKKCKVKEPVTQQHIKNARLVIKKTLRDQYLQNWLETQNKSSTSSREKFTEKEVKNNYHFENYLTSITKPAHRISLTRLRLACHTLRIQTGKYENRGALIPVEERTSLVCKENCIEGEQHFWMHCRGYTTLRHELHSHISNTDTHYPSLRDDEKTRYLLRAENTITSKIIGKYIHLMFQKRKEILDSKM